MADHRSFAILATMQAAWWIGLGAKWLLLMRRDHKPACEATGSKYQHTPGGFASHALPRRTDSTARDAA
jgi:hypothetical protein